MNNQNEKECNLLVMEAMKQMAEVHNNHGGNILVTISAASGLIGNLINVLSTREGMDARDFFNMSAEIMSEAFVRPMMDFASTDHKSERLH